MEVVAKRRCKVEQELELLHQAHCGFVNVSNGLKKPEPSKSSRARGRPEDGYGNGFAADIAEAIARPSSQVSIISKGVG